MRGESDAGGPTAAWPIAPATSGPTGPGPTGPGPTGPGSTALGSTGRRPAASATLGLQALADTLDRASLNMGIAALDGARSAAAKTGPAVAAEAARRLADQMVEQMKGLEAVLAELDPPRR